MTLQSAETASPSIADVMALLHRMPAGERDSVLAACAQEDEDAPSHLLIPFDAAYAPADWRSILDVSPIEVLAPTFASRSWRTATPCWRCWPTSSEAVRCGTLDHVDH